MYLRKFTETSFLIKGQLTYFVRKVNKYEWMNEWMNEKFYYLKQCMAFINDNNVGYVGKSAHKNYYMHELEFVCKCQVNE